MKTQKPYFVDWKIIEKKILKERPGVEKEYQRLKPEFDAIEKIIELRMRKKLSQKELAMRLKTKQPALSRIETGASSPTIEFLSRLAQAVGKKLEINFK